MFLLGAEQEVLVEMLEMVELLVLVLLELLVLPQIATDWSAMSLKMSGRCPIL
jgi:competence protein ComGC